MNTDFFFQYSWFSNSFRRIFFIISKWSLTRNSNIHKNQGCLPKARGGTGWPSLLTLFPFILPLLSYPQLWPSQQLCTTLRFNRAESEPPHISSRDFWFCWNSGAPCLHLHYLAISSVIMGPPWGQRLLDSCSHSSSLPPTATQLNYFSWCLLSFRL